MSTKNLARTSLEGGRHHFNSWARRQSNVTVRHAARALSASIKNDDDATDALYPKRKSVWRSFDDKLAPAFRWLERQVGRPWNKVRAELTARFDTRTTAGRHILFCHLLPSVQKPSRHHSRHQPVYVDRHGLLQATSRKVKER